MAKAIPVTVFGISFSSKREACIAYNQNPSKIDHRIKKGMTIEEALVATDRYTGVKKHHLYSIWNGIRSRCYSKSSSSLRYKGRITMCDRWFNDFWLFVEDMGDPPGVGFSVDREDNSKGYCKDNCRWVTRKDQQRNMTSNRKIKCFGTTRLLVEWSEITGLSAQIISDRLKRMGVEDALTKPLRGK